MRTAGGPKSFDYCRRGGTDGHSLSECGALKSSCNNCKKKGDPQRVHRSKPKTTVNSATVIEKRWIICRKISSFLQISLTGNGHTASVKKERFFSQSKESLQETSSFYLIASQRRSQRDRSMKAENPLAQVHEDCATGHL